MAIIRTYNSVPSVYTHKSRDFQIIGHLYEAIFNSSKLAADMVDRMMPNDNFDERLINLSATTQGFTTKHEYSTRDLSMILSSFASLLKIKGTKKAIDSAINIMLRSQGISDEYVWLELDEKKKFINLGISDRLVDRALLFDLFEYLLPFGFTYRITNYSSSQLGENATVISSYSDSATVTVGKNEQFLDQAIVSKDYRTTQTIVDVLPDSITSVNPSPINNGNVE